MASLGAGSPKRECQSLKRFEAACACELGGVAPLIAEQTEATNMPTNVRLDLRTAAGCNIECDDAAGCVSDKARQD